MGLFKLFSKEPNVWNLAKSQDVEGLTKALSHRMSSRVRRTAAEALRELGDERAVLPLIVALRDKDCHVQLNAAVALGKIGDTRAVAPLIDTLNRKTEWDQVRNVAAGALGRIRDTDAVDPLIVALRDDSAYVRAAAAWALGEIGDARAVYPLIAALNDNDTKGFVGDWPPVCDKAVESLIRIGKPAVGPLITALKDNNAEVRYLVVKALGEIGDSQATSPLMAALKDEPRVAYCAARALKKMGYRPLGGFPPEFKAMFDEK